MKEKLLYRSFCNKHDKISHERLYDIVIIYSKLELQTIGRLMWRVLEIWWGGWVACQLSMYCLSALNLPSLPCLWYCSSLWPAGPVLSFASWGGRKDTAGGREFSYTSCCDPLPTGSCGTGPACRAPTGRSISGEAFPQVPQALHLVSWSPSRMGIFHEFLRSPSLTFHPKVISKSSMGAPHGFWISSASSPSLPPLQQLLANSVGVQPAPSEFNQWTSLISLGSSPPTGLRSLTMD